MSDAVTRSLHGHADVFELAATLFAPHTRLEEPRAIGQITGEVQRERLDSLIRAGLVVMGGLVGLLTQSFIRAPDWSVVSVGVAAWVCGQACAALAWHHLGSGAVTQVVPRALGLGLLLAPVAMGLMALRAPSEDWSGLLRALLLMSVWISYTMLTGVLIVLGALPQLLVLGPVVVGAVLGRWWLGLPDLALGLTTVALLGYLLVLAGLQPRSVGPPPPRRRRDRQRRRPAHLPGLPRHHAGQPAAGRHRRVGVAGTPRTGRGRVRLLPRLPSGEDLAAAAPALLQAALLSATVVAALGHIDGPSDSALLAGTLLGAAAADPALVYLRQRLRDGVGARFSLTEARREACWSALVSLLAPTVVTGVAIWASGILLFGTVRQETLLVGGAFTLTATASAALVALGAPWSGVLVAAAAALASEAAPDVRVQLWLSVLPWVMATVLLMRRVANPRVWS